MAFEGLQVAIRQLRDEMAATERRLRAARLAYERLNQVTLQAIGCAPPDLQSVLARLTPRERLVAALVAEGYSNREVALRLQVSVHTVKTQMRSVLRKLEMRRRWEIERLCRGAGNR
jgi:DNA-binding NarL/FixJ family response regulator